MKSIGLALQLGGLALAGLGVVETRRTYDGPPLFQDAWRQFKEILLRVWQRVRAWFPRSRCREHPAEGSVPIKSGVHLGTPGVLIGMPETLTVDEKLDWLAVKALRFESDIFHLDAASKVTITRVNEIGEKVDEVKKTAIEHTNTEVRNLAVNGLSLQAVGLFAAAFGTVLDFIGDILPTTEV